MASFRDRADRRERERDRNWDRDRDRDKHPAVRPGGESHRPGNPYARRDFSHGDRDRDRDRERDERPPLRRQDSSKSVQSPASYSSPVHPSRGSSPIRRDPASERTPVKTRTIQSPQHQATHPNQQAKEAKQMMDIISERSLWYRHKYDASKKLDNLKAQLENLASGNPEFVSEHQLWKSKQKEAESQKTKAASKMEDLDQKTPLVLLALLEKHQKQSVSPSTLEARMLAIEKKFEEKITECEKKLKDDHEAEKLELVRRLDEEASKNQQLEEKLQELASKVEQISNMSSERNGRQEQLERQVTQLKDDVDLPMLNEVKEKVEVQVRQVADLTALQEARDSQGRQLASAQTSAKSDNTPVEKVTELDMKLSTFQSMVKDVLGDVRNAETKISQHDTAIEQLQRQSRAQSQTPTVGNKASSPVSDSNTGHGTSNTPDASIYKYVDGKFKENETQQRSKFDQLAKRLGGFIDAERVEREGLGKKVGTLSEDMAKERGQREELGGKVAKLEVSYDGMGKDLEDLKTAPNGSSNTAEKGTLVADRRAQDKAEMDKLWRTIADNQGVFNAKAEEDRRIFEDHAARISHLNLWRENFSSADLSKNIVAHIANAIPQGVQTQMRYIHDRITNMEGRLRNGDSEITKKRKAGNGTAVAVNGYQ